MTQTTRVEEKQNRFLQYVKRRAFLGELLTFFVALLLGRICIAGDIAPFGLAFLAAASISGCNAHYALAGAVFGEILLQAEPQYPAVCACVLYYVMHLLWNCWSRKNAKLDQLFLLFLAQAALLPIFYAGDVPTLLRALINIGLCEFSALAMQSALRTLRMLATGTCCRMRNRSASACFLAFCCWPSRMCRRLAFPCRWCCCSYSP